MMKYSATGMLILLIGIISCNQEANKGKRGFTTSETKIVEINNEYQISLPDYFEPTSNLNDLASLQYMNVQKETYVFVISESKSGFVDSHIEVGYYDEAQSILENYRNRQLSLIQNNIVSKDINYSKGFKIKGQPALTVDFSGSIESVPNDIFYMIGFIEGKDKIYMIMNWTLLSRKDLYKKDFKNIIRSFEFL